FFQKKVYLQLYVKVRKKLAKKGFGFGAIRIQKKKKSRFSRKSGFFMFLLIVVIFSRRHK
ncbi:hypothetical protein, partial [Ornithobacterium rhinotracheale]|uniref:hypothetical protein n=1 Tax=Ornithobacterium rhinotracheale TaxID=28251 RepID=UPI003873048D